MHCSAPEEHSTVFFLTMEQEAFSKTSSTSMDTNKNWAICWRQERHRSKPRDEQEMLRKALARFLPARIDDVITSRSFHAFFSTPTCLRGDCLNHRATILELDFLERLSRTSWLNTFIAWSSETDFSTKTLSLVSLLVNLYPISLVFALNPTKGSKINKLEKRLTL